MFGLRNGQRVVATEVEQALADKYSDAELALLDQYGTVLDDIPAGTALATEGQVGREVMLITKGSAVVSRDGEIIAEVGPGDVIGERAVVTSEPRNATVMTTTTMTALVFTALEFRSLLHQSGRLATDIDQLISQRD